uniref:Lcl C-terminal domain-containing protein n=1 Tax=Candidatus Electronema sp. TaxID=2698783 RepID=UPI0040564029
MNDTGITWSGTGATGNGTTCTDANQDCSFGWDNTDGADNTNGHAGFKFTKLDNNGDVATGAFGCVRDERTGLIWEVITSSSTTKNWAAAKTYAASFSACGKTSGWRLPTVKELLGIVLLDDIVKDPVSPVVDTAYFLETAMAGYWTNTEVADADTAVEAWIVNFSTAMTAQQDASLLKNVRLVHD